MTHAKTHGTSDRNGGHPPCVWTMCKGQCEGTGTVPNEGSNGRWSHDNCDDCGGTGKRIDGPEAVLLEVAHGFVYPVQFALFWCGEYGFFADNWRESWASGSAISAFRMVWRDTRWERSDVLDRIVRSVR